MDPDRSGDLHFQYNAPNGSLTTLHTIRTAEINLELRYVPFERFYQGNLYRTPIVDRYPIFTPRYNQALRGFTGGDYSYENLTANVSKLFCLSQLGYADVSTEGGYLFGQAPFPLLDIHRANRSYAFQFLLAMATPIFRPELNHTFSFNYSTYSNGSFNAGLSYTFSNNSIQFISLLGAEGVTNNTYSNLGKNARLSGYISASYPLSPRLNLDAYAEISRAHLPGMIDGLN